MSVVCNFDTDLTKCTNKVTFDIVDVRPYAILHWFDKMYQQGGVWHLRRQIVCNFCTDLTKTHQQGDVLHWERQTVCNFCTDLTKTRQQGDVWHWERQTVCNFDTDLTICINKVTFDTGNVRLYAILALIWQKCSFDTDVRLYRWRLNRLYAILTL